MIINIIVSVLQVVFYCCQEFTNFLYVALRMEIIDCIPNDSA